MYAHRFSVMRAALILGLLGQVLYSQLPGATFAGALISPISPLVSPLAPPVSTVQPAVSPQASSPLLVNAASGGRAYLSTHVTVDFAPGALQANTLVSATESSPPDFVAAVDSPVGIHIRLLPDIAAFDAPVTLTVDLSGFLTYAMWDRGVHPILYYLRPVVVTDTASNLISASTVITHESYTREVIPATFDPVSNRLTARLSHFSDYSIDSRVSAGAPEAWKFVPNPGGVNLFRGATTFQMPINVPQMPDGTQPLLNLTYSSAGTDASAQGNYRLGYGWDLDSPHITQGVKREGIVGWQGYAASLRFMISEDNQYRLSLGGVSYNLIPRGGKLNGKQEYVTESYAPLRVLQCDPGYSSTCDGFAVPYPDFYETIGQRVENSQTNCGSSDYAPIRPSYWQVWTADGTRYVLGLDKYSTTRYDTYDNHPIDKKFAYQGWYLSRVYSARRDDPTANRWTAEYQYEEESNFNNGRTDDGIDCTMLGSNYEHHNRLVSIRYGNSRGIGSSAMYSVTFTSSTIGNLARLTGINVWANGTQVRRYDIGISGHWISGGNVYDDYVVASLGQATLNGVNWASLPATTFEYGRTTDHLITAVNTGYGGRVEYTYGEGDDHHQTTAKKYHYATQRLTRDGNGNDVLDTYDYAAPCFNDLNAGCWFGHDDLFTEAGINDTRGNLVGYGQVTQNTALSGGTSVARTQHNLSTVKNTLGFELETRYKDGAGAVLKATKTDYILVLGAPLNLPTGAWFAAPQTVTSYIAGDIGASPYTRISYAYNDAYGSPTAIYEFGLDTISGDERTTYRAYNSNSTASAWIVGKVLSESVYAGSGGPAVAQTRLFYDGALDPNTQPTIGNLTQVDQALDAQWVRVQQAAYDVAGNPVVITDANGNADRRGYDPTGLFVVSSTNPLGQITRYAYYGVNGNGVQGAYSDTFGLLKTITDTNGAATEYVYDPFGRLTKVIRPYDSSTLPSLQYTYTTPYATTGFTGLRIEEARRTLSGCADCVQSTLSFYDGLGKLQQTRTPFAAGAQVVVNTKYDALGKAAWSNAPVTESLSAQFTRTTGWDTRPGVTTRYDALGRPVVVTSTDGTIVTSAYLGATTIVTDANGHRKTSTADAYGRLQTVVEYSGTAVYTTTYSYDTLNSLTRVVDALGNTTVITYDGLGRKMSMADPDMGVWTYGYDPVGNLITQTDALNQMLWFKYDGLNRLIEKRLNGSAGTLQASYGYDQSANGIGRRTSAWNPNATTSWGYDARGRVVTQTKTVSSTYNFTTTFGYDAADRVVTMTQPGGEVVRTTYNTAGQPYSLQGANAYVVSATYNALGQVASQAFGNSVIANYTYRADNFRLQRIQVGSSILDRQYGYDPVGNITSINDALNGENLSFTYDPLDRLTSASGAFSEIYRYDAVGNMTSKAGLTFSYTDTLHKHAVTALSDESAYQYDRNGNMTRRLEAGISYTQTWDIDNHLANVAKGNSSTQYYYDADGALVRKVEPRGQTVYASADYEVFYPTVVTVTVPSTFTHKLYMPFVSIAQTNGPCHDTCTYYRFNGQQVAVRTGGTVYWLHADHLGSASATTDFFGTKVSELRYKPYGETRYSSGSTPTDKRFTSQEEDSYSNIYSMGARWYSPVFGRFLSPDTIVPRPGDPQALNRFSYAGNSPLNRLDPSGHFDISAFIAGFSDQYVDDLSLGLHSSMNVNVAERMHSDDSAEYNIGRVGGQLGALLFAGTEIGSGGTMAGGSIAAGGGCAVLTIGACAPIGAAVALGGATVGVGMVGHGLLIAGKVLSNGDPRNNLVLASNSAELANNLGPRPTPDSDAHHIIPVNDQRGASLRTLLGKAGIDINAAANGVYLPGDSKSSSLPGYPNAAIHSKLNTYEYYRQLYRRFENAQPDQVRPILDQIRKDLMSGNFPY